MPFRKNEPKSQDAMSEGARPPRVLTARTIATGPVAAKMNATTPLTTCSPPRSASDSLKMGSVPLFYWRSKIAAIPCPPPMHIVTSA